MSNTTVVRRTLAHHVVIGLVTVTLGIGLSGCGTALGSLSSVSSSIGGLLSDLGTGPAPLDAVTTDADAPLGGQDTAVSLPWLDDGAFELPGTGMAGVGLAAGTVSQHSAELGVSDTLGLAGEELGTSDAFDPNLLPSPAASGSDSYTPERQQAQLQQFLDGEVQGMVDRGERQSGTGFLPAWWNNTSTLFGIDDRKTCFSQADVVYQSLRQQQNAGGYDGWSFEKFDQTAPWRKGDGIDHMFVLGTSPEGRKFSIDPWYGTVKPYEEKVFTPGVWDFWTKGNGGILNVIDYYQGR